MKTLRHVLLSAHLLLTGLLLGSSANAGVNVSLNLGYFPELAPVPGYPVYYAPRVSANFFFYDGAYWLFEDDRWFTSDWYDGPWDYVDPFYVPAFVLRVPVRYYHVPPPWFRGGYYDAPPRWGHYWGSHWSQRRYGWDHWDHHRPPAPAPLPYYQRNYHGDRYPWGARQQELHRQHYREPRQRQREQANRDHGERRDFRERDAHQDRRNDNHNDYRNRQRDTERHQAGRREERRELHRASQFPRQPESRPDHRFNPEQRQRVNQEQHQRTNHEQRQRNYQEQHQRARQEQRQPDRQQRDQRPSRQHDQSGWQARQADAGQWRGNRPDRERQERPRHDNRGRDQQR